MRAKGSIFLALTLAAMVAPQAWIDAGELPYSSVNAVGATLRWTAPGDDWNVGQASRYDLRFSTTPISGTDSLTWWNSTRTTVCTGLPAPGMPGSTDSFAVNGLVPGRTYYFVLRTADEIPNWSFFSNVAIINVSSLPDTSVEGDNTPPAPVAGLSATPGPQGILLNWSPSPEPDVAGYIIYRGYEGGELSALTDVLIQTTSYVDMELIAGVTYSYAVTATDSFGNESAVAQSASATAPSVGPAMTRLLAPFPDPCVKQALLRFDIAERAAMYTLRIFDINGRLVKELGHGSAIPGQYSKLWDLTGDGGERVAPGIYFSVLTTERASSSKKLLVLSE